MALDDAHPGPLPCGTVLDELIAQVIDGRTPGDTAHQAACRYCQAAIAALGEAWEEFQSIARSAVAVPEDLAQRIITRIRGLARTTGEGVVIGADRGETRIADKVLARLARANAIEVPDVALATVIHTGEDLQAPGTVWIALRLVVGFGASMDKVADAVRSRVISSAQGQLGTVVSRVDVAIEDVVFGAERIS